MKQKTSTRYTETLGANVRITATPTDSNIRIVGSLDGSKDNFDNITIDPNTGTTIFNFRMNGPGGHDASFQLACEFSQGGSVTFQVACEHKDSFDAGSKDCQDRVPRKNLRFDMEKA